jgi:hypothetical protein
MDGEILSRLAASFNRKERRTMISYCMHAHLSVKLVPSFSGFSLSLQCSFHPFSLQSCSFSLLWPFGRAFKCVRVWRGWISRSPVVVHPEYAHKFIIEYYSLKRQWYHLNMKRRSLVNGSAEARHPVGAEMPIWGVFQKCIAIIVHFRGCQRNM